MPYTHPHHKTYNAGTVGDTTAFVFTILLVSNAWTPNSMTFSVNDKTFFTYVKPEHAGFETWPFDQPYYLVVDLAEGGTWCGMDKKIYPPDGINNAQLPTTMKISRIDYYPYVGKRP